MANFWSDNGRKSGRPSPYTYLPLNARYGEIRLLSIPRKIPGSDTLVDCTLSHTADWNIRRFTALSYCWGNPIFDHDLTVNGRSMRITESLATALTSIQSENEDIVVWADAICINHRDSVEKTTQVQLMRDIYRAASQVIIWLGPSYPETSLSMQGLQQLGDQLLQAGLWELRPGDIAHWEVDNNDTCSIARTKRAVLQLISEHLAKARNKENPFWWIASDLGKRKWFHECANARIATFRCGEDEVDYTRMWAVSLSLSVFTNRSHLDIVDDDVQAWEQDVWLFNILSNALPSVIINLRRTHLLKGGHDLRTLLDRVIVSDLSPHSIGATGPRDRIYALLGIANGDAARAIVADYTLSCEQVYIMTARALLRYGNDDVLSLCRVRDLCRNLPSWVPDWSANPRKPWSVWQSNKRLYDASILFNNPPKFSMVSCDEQTFDVHLSLEGYFVDTVEELGHAFHLGPDERLIWASMQPYFNDITHFLSQSRRYTATEKKEAEWRIPIGDTEIVKENNQMIRATHNSYMIDGYYAARAMLSDRTGQIFPSLACFQTQLTRMYDSQPFISKNGYVGLCPLGTQSGDTIVIFKGARVPHIIRKKTSEPHWTLIGESHVYGIMDGEFMLTKPEPEVITLC